MSNSLMMLASLAIVGGIAVETKTPNQVWDAIRDMPVNLPGVSFGTTISAKLDGSGSLPFGHDGNSNWNTGSVGVVSIATVPTGPSNGGTKVKYRATVYVTLDKKTNTYSHDNGKPTAFEVADGEYYGTYGVRGAEIKKFHDKIVQILNDFAK